MLPELVSLTADIAQLALIGVGIYVAYCVVLGLFATAAVGSCVLRDYRADRRALNARLREDAEVAALEQIPTPGPWDMEVSF